MAKGKAVTLQAMADQIGMLNRDRIADALSSRRAFVRYDFAEFQRNMMRNELLIDKRTIRHKWDVLCANDVIRKNVGVTYLSIDALMGATSFEIGDILDRLADEAGEREGGTYSTDPGEASA